MNIEDLNKELEHYGIRKHKASARCVELISEDFFYDCTEELAPFGSDTGDTALSEFRSWRKENPTCPTIECLRWVIEDISELPLEKYNDSLIDEARIKKQMADQDFDDEYFIYTLDNTVIATGFAQLVDEGVIETQNKEIIQIAIDRQRIWTKLLKDWEYAEEYLGNLDVLERALKAA